MTLEMLFLDVSLHGNIQLESQVRNTNPFYNVCELQPG